MATSFPSSLDSFTNPSASDALDSVSVPHADQHADLNDAMEAVQTKLGTGSGTIGEWTDYTPTLTFFVGSGLTYTINVARYCKINKLVFVNFDITVTGGTGLRFPRITMPTSYTTGGGRGGGSGRFSTGVLWVWDIQTAVTGYRYDGNGDVASGVTMHAAIQYEES